jgi:predicted nucleic acid-binding Zn ribbon protein
MPIREHVCGNDSCTEYGKVLEKYFSSSAIMDRDCGECSAPMQLVLSTFGIVFTGPITSKYLDHKAEVNRGDGGHWVFETRGLDGQKIEPKARFISTFQEQRDFCKREGLVDPSSIGPAEVGSDGKTLSSRGLPGCW